MNPKILIVEDNTFLSSVLKGRLEKEGFQVEQAFDGEQMFEILKQQIPDLIIMDLIMPKKSGFECLDQMAADPQLSKIPVVIASNLGQESDVGRVRGFINVFGYFIKAQVTIDQLAENVKQMFAGPSDPPPSPAPVPDVPQPPVAETP